MIYRSQDSTYPIYIYQSSWNIKSYRIPSQQEGLQGIIQEEEDNNHQSSTKHNMHIFVYVTFYICIVWLTIGGHFWSSSGLQVWQ